MGSKKKTVRQLGYSKVLPQDKDLYIENILKTVASAKSINPVLINNALLRVNRYYGFEAFKKLDAAVMVEGSSSEFNMAEVYAKLGLDCTKDKPTGATTSAFVKDKFLYRIGPSKGTCGGFELFNDQYVYDSFQELPSGQLQAARYTCNPADGTTTFDTTITVPGLNDSVVVLDIERNTGGITTENWRYRIARNDANKVEAIDSMTFLAGTYKANFVKNKGRTLRAFNAIMGIPNRTPKTKKKDCDNWDAAANKCLDDDDSFESTLDNADYKHIFMTYCVPYEDPYKDIIDSIYGGKKSIELKFHGITVTAGYNNDFSGIQTNPVNPNYCDAEMTGNAAAFKVDGVTMSIDPDEDEKPQFLIPMEVFRLRRDLREKHDDIGNALTFVVMAEKTVKLKWYQTGFFRIFMWVVALVAAVYGFPQMLIGMVTSTVLSMVFGDKIAAIVGILMAIYTLGTSLATAAVNMMSIFQQIADIASQIASLYFKSTIEDIQNKLEDISEQSKKTQEAIDEMSKEMLYIPIGDVLDTIYATMYDLMYNGAYSMVYNYDRMITVDHMRQIK